ncbi:SIR2 family protein [Acidocella sp.]|uniref:SIR2 family protein n=1 Tax=Acidocella sp. TaxID=50710 RepID=UPI00262D5C29|nr:SIR2 family protein [Acidocella sp.]
MTDVSAAPPPPKFSFLRDGTEIPSELDWDRGPETIRKAIGEALNARHVAFLLGAGCSSLKLADAELGIATMQPLAKEFCAASVAPAAAAASGPPPWALSAEESSYLAEMGISLVDPEYQRNLERLMEALHSLRFVLRRSLKPLHQDHATLVEAVIEKVKTFLWERCTNGAFAQGDAHVLDLYEQFYRKLVLRDRSLPRPWVFTTNYDLFNERAMDRLGLPYANGFSGVVERRFNPAMFRYALAEQLDLSHRKWSAVDGFVYLCKLHGSISWTEDDHGLFPIREQWPSHGATKVMIYPTPAKQNSSLGSPYADLFREFQFRIVREQSVLITAGYAFGDEHLNHLIYQALTIPTFRLIIFADPMSGGEIAKLRALRDPRIWIIGGDGPTDGLQAHYFDQIVSHFMPQRAPERIEAAVRKVLESMGTVAVAPAGEEEA